jgi:acetyl/propionyl-CoA carboxylase alpha subunit
MLFEGLDVPVFYDSLLGKLIVWAETRERAVERMKRALRDLIISGPQTNVPFHLALLDHPDFQSGDFATNWLEQHFTMPQPAEGDPRLEQALIAGAVAANLIGGAVSSTGATAAGLPRWTQASRSMARRGIRIEEGTRGWRRGTVSR